MRTHKVGISSERSTKGKQPASHGHQHTSDAAMEPGAFTQCPPLSAGNGDDGQDSAWEIDRRQGLPGH